MRNIKVYQRDLFGGMKVLEEYGRSWATRDLQDAANIIEEVFGSRGEAEAFLDKLGIAGSVVKERETGIYMIIKEEYMGLDLDNNPLTNRGKGFEAAPKVIKSTIEKYGEVRNINQKLFKKVDLEDREYVNRLDSAEEIMASENFGGLVESIKGVGLLNQVYLLEKQEGYRIISGWRRSLALSRVFEEDSNRVFQEKAIVLAEDTPTEVLEQISLDENTKRMDLSILELSYKFNRFAQRPGVSVEDCLKIFNIGKTQFHAIKKAMDFHPPVKAILEEVGAKKADILNKIYEIDLELHGATPGYDFKKVLNEYKEKTFEELKTVLRETKAMNRAKSKVKSYDVKKGKKKVNIVINKQLEEDDYDRLMKFIETLCG